jgi:hypothetical protein
MQSPEHPKGISMYQPGPSAGQLTGPSRPATPAPVLTWLADLCAVWLLWRPAANAFFKPQGVV